MKVTSVIFSITSLATIASASWTQQLRLGVNDSPKTQDDSLKVPGENPLFFCADPSDDLLSIDYVDLNPNPPTPGNVLTITASGNLSEPIEAGAHVRLQVKYGLITLIKQDADLCEQAGNIDLECPIEAGKMTLTKEVELPSQIPPGKYTVLADVYTKDEVKITCLTAQVYFHRG